MHLDETPTSHRIFAAFLAATSMLLGAETARAELAASIQKALQAPILRHSQVGIAVRSLTRDKTLYEKNAYQPLNPASTLKIVTTQYALDTLKPSYRFQTVFATNRVLAPGVIDALYVKGGGDPYFVIERLWRVAGDMKALGLKEIRGPIVIDNGFFDEKFFAPGWPEEPGPQAYFAPTAAFSVNFNTIVLRVTPGVRAGDPARVSLEPDVPSAVLESTAKTSGSGKDISFDKVSRGDKDIFRVGGHIALGSTPVVKYRNVSDPLRYAGEVVKLVFTQQGISVAGAAKVGTTPKSATELFVEESPPLSSIIKEVNKLSNNFMAEMILKSLAALKVGAPGTTRAGAELLQDYLKSLKIPPAEFHLENGSGLSRSTRISPHALLTVLETGWKDPRSSAEYLSSFARAGEDGTVDERRPLVKAPAFVRAKTGSLNGVSTICGFITRQDGDLVAFVILMNDVPGTYGMGHPPQDQIIAAISESRE